ncbi:dTDP-4-dehydrorhamnose 3,5-epimerase [compost metagenome]
MLYKVDQVFTPAADSGIRWDDPSLAIDWPVYDPLLSDKDRNLPLLQSFIEQYKGLESV